MKTPSDELSQLYQEKRFIWKDLHHATNRCNRLKTMYCLIAAHNYDLALLHASLVTHRNTWDEAEDMSDFINFISSGKFKPPAEDFMPHPEEYSNKSIDEYSKYENYKNHPSGINKKLIESFSKWYTNDRNNSAWIKVNYFFLESIFTHSVEVYNNQITDQEYSDFIKWLRAEDFAFSFHEKYVAKAFIIAKNKILEIESKIKIREYKSAQLRIV
jgi:hypothetical protein